MVYMILKSVQFNQLNVIRKAVPKNDDVYSWPTSTNHFINYMKTVHSDKS